MSLMGHRMNTPPTGLQTVAVAQKRSAYRRRLSDDS